MSLNPEAVLRVEKCLSLPKLRTPLESSEPAFPKVVVVQPCIRSHFWNIAWDIAASLGILPRMTFLVALGVDDHLCLSQGLQTGGFCVFFSPPSPFACLYPSGSVQ